jgi:hypothetical protein
MRTLTIDYLLEGTRRGYNFTTPTDDIPPETLKTIWRQAMPRGKDWGVPAYKGAAAVKCFPLESGEMAVCHVAITGMRDEMGRAGIRRAEISILQERAYFDYLRGLLNAMPPNVVAEAEAKLTSREWQLLFKKHRRENPPKSFVKPQTILAYPYSEERWPFVEACILLLATRSTLLANLIEVSPAVNPFADRALSFTTLALDYRDETRLIAVPLEKARTFEDVPYIDIS